MKKFKISVLLVSIVSMSLLLFAGISYAAQSHSSGGGHSSASLDAPTSSTDQHTSGSTGEPNTEPAEVPQENHDMSAEEHNNMPEEVHSNEMNESNSAHIEQSTETHGDSAGGHGENVSDEVNWPVVGSFIIINLIIILAAAIVKPRRSSKIEEVVK